MNTNSNILPAIRTSQCIIHSHGNDLIRMNCAPTSTRLPTTVAITRHQAPATVAVDVNSSASLIDRMFAQLSQESENMRQRIAIEKDIIALERTRQTQETERELRRERVLIDTLMKYHEQLISVITRLLVTIDERCIG